MSAFILYPNGVRQDVSPSPRGNELNPKTFTLEEMQNIVGGYIEVVSLDDDVYMIVDEEGKLKGKYVNRQATKIFNKYTKTLDFIVGTVLICTTDMVE